MKKMQLEIIPYYLKSFEWDTQVMVVKQDAYFDEKKSISISDDWAILEAVVLTLWETWIVIRCALLGCDYQDDSPPDCGESGAWAFSCSRCGFGHSGYMTG